MTRDAPSPVRRLAAALVFAAGVWRAVAPVQALAAAGVAAAVAALAAPGLGGGSTLFAVGLAVSFVAWAPLLGALHRAALLDPDRRELAFGGLQIGPVELRLWALAGALLGAIGLAACLTVAALAAVFLVLGPGRPAFLAAGLVAAAAGGGFLWLIARLSAAPARTVAEGRLVLLESLPLTRGRDLEILVAAVLALLPGAVALAPFALPDDGRGGLLGAAAAGLWAGVVLAFVQLPVLVGVLSGLYGGLAPVAGLASPAREPEPFAG